MKINVTQEHIVRGERRRAYGCPIYQAIKEQTGLRAGIDGHYANLNEGTFSYQRIPLPKEATQFIHDFDDERKPVEPFSFEFPLEPAAATCPMCDGAGTITVAEKPQQKELCHDLVQQS